MNDLRIELRFKNAILARALEDQLGDKAKEVQSGPMLPIIKVSSEAIGIDHRALSALLNLKQSPWSRNGDRNQNATKISDFLGIQFDELFPAALYAGKFSSARIAEMSSAKLLPLREAMRLPAVNTAEKEYEQTQERQAISKALDTLPPRHRQTLEMRFGIDDGKEKTLDAVGRELGVSRDRIRQIEASALRKLREPSRVKILKEGGVESSK